MSIIEFDRKTNLALNLFFVVSPKLLMTMVRNAVDRQCIFSQKTRKNAENIRRQPCFLWVIDNVGAHVLLSLELRLIRWGALLGREWRGDLAILGS